MVIVELLAPLTWPIEVHDQMTVNHVRHTPFLQHAQVMYKRAILGTDVAPILRSIIRIGLPCLQVPRADRSARDDGILKLILYLFRNLAVISPTHATGDEEEASRSATIDAFHDQDVFALLLTMCSNIGDDFSFQDVVLLETIFHLVKGVDAKKLFSDNEQQGPLNELQNLLGQEAALNREYAKTAPTRHGRFGTMVWVKRDDEKMSTVSGQEALLDNRATLLKMDETKKWKKPRRRKEDDPSIYNFGQPCPLTPIATERLRVFVEEFLDSGFNPLFIHIRKAMEREAERITEVIPVQFFYLIGWFLEAERLRRERQARARRDIEPDSFASVAGVLNQETFVALNRHMQASLDNKEWRDVTSTLLCFTQILLTVQEMAKSPAEDDQEIAENIQNRIFYEETTHDRIVAILRGYKDQGFPYLDACTELSFIFLRMLERYSKGNEHMQVRSRRARKKRQPQPELSDDEEQEDRSTVIERSFDFKRFSSKLCTQQSVNTFVTFIGYYKDLNVEQLKRAHRFFYRVAFKQQMPVLLYRVDIISLLYRMIKGPLGLNQANPMFKEWEELTRQILRRMIKKLEQRPALLVEMLFSKTNATLFNLEYGQDKQTMGLQESRPPAELEVKPGVEDPVGVLVSVLLLDKKEELVRWFHGVYQSITNERSSWELAAEARQRDTEKPVDSTPPSTSKFPLGKTHPTTNNSPDITPDQPYQIALFKNAKLRLLLTLCGAERVGAEDKLGTPWMIPASVPSVQLRACLSSIEKHLASPLTDADGIDPRSQIRRKRQSGRDVAVDPSTTLDVDFGDESEGDEELLFPPNPRERGRGQAQRKSWPRRRVDEDEDEDGPMLDEETLEARRRKRQLNALERQRKIKSDLFVHASDEEEDDEEEEEFFKREERRREEQADRVRKAMLIAPREAKDMAKDKRKGKGKTKKAVGRKKRKGSDEDSDSSDSAHRKRQRNVSYMDGDDIGYGEGDNADSADSDAVPALLPASRPRSQSSDDAPFFWSGDRTPRVVDEDEEMRDVNGSDGGGDDDRDDVPAAPASRRLRTMAGFVIDSDSE